MSNILKSDEPIYVLDANVFINNISYMFNDKVCITTPFVEDEMKSSHAKMDFYRASQTNLNVILPKKEFILKAKEIASRTKHKASMADISIVALALEFKSRGKRVIVVSDDYSIQDMCIREGIEVVSLTKEKIKEHYTWQRVCIYCNKESNQDVCEICGSKTLYVAKKTKISSPQQ